MQQAIRLDDLPDPRPRSRERGGGFVGVLLRIGLVAFLVTLTAGFVLDRPAEPKAAPVEKPAFNTNVPVRSVPIEPEPVQVAPLTSSTRLPDMRTCPEIKGTEYRSAAERDWYLSNCGNGAPGFGLPAIPGPEVKGERWVLVDIEKQQASAMIGDRAIHTALVTTGKEGWETPRGSFAIIYRVANETMTSASIGAEEDYVLKDVLYTQYFTTEGHALHLNYWRSADYFGRTPSSHGCVGMRLADAEFFWRFAKTGTRVTTQ